MPPKRKKGGAAKGKGKAKGKKAAAAAAEREETVRMCRAFLRAYQQSCAAAGSVPSPLICRDCRDAIENEKPLAKFILECSQPVPPRARPLPVPTSLSGGRLTDPPVAAKTGAALAMAAGTSEGPRAGVGEALTSSPVRSGVGPASITAGALRPVEAAASPPPSPLLTTLTSAWAEVRYRHVRSLHVWKVPLLDDSVVQLALFLDSPLGKQLQSLELMDANLSSWSITRLARSLQTIQLTALKLDYNHLPPPTLTSLCESLQQIPSLQTLSLSYCHLGPACGEPLGNLLALSRIRELSVRGNALECDGASEIIRPVVALCETREVEAPPPLARLDLQDNGMDGRGNLFLPVLCMRVFGRWIASSPFLEDLSLEGNEIGDGGAREIMVAMQGRKDAGLPASRVAISPRVSTEIFAAIVELNASRKKGGKKKGRKGKKKK